MTEASALFEPFPPVKDREFKADQNNPAIRLYGRRFYQDQTPVEYLAELLLVFASPKEEGGGATFSLSVDDAIGTARYWPEDRVALKLFAFFPTSRLDTRHAVHRKAYGEAISEIRSRIDASDTDKDEVVRLLQSLLGGFVGLVCNRTWVTNTFLPASTVLLGREVAWLHSAAQRKRDLNDWEDVSHLFARDRHLFMARGGELLFLQLANLFASPDSEAMMAGFDPTTYKHLHQCELSQIQVRLELGLRAILESTNVGFTGLVGFIENALSRFRIDAAPREACLGWVPVVSRTEALLFAYEMDNICASTLGSLEKLDLLQLLCCMQVLRSLCFQASRFDNGQGNTNGFVGNYAWIVVDPEARSGMPLRMLAQSSFDRVQELLYRVLRQARQEGAIEKKFNEARKHGFKIFARIAKQLGLVIPRTSVGQRFVLPPALLRFLVAALIPPGQRVRLNVFYERVFAHYGIALGSQQLATALHWMGGESGPADYAVATDTGWLEEALQQGGFLVELSDAVSMVHNPGAGRDAA